MMYFLLLLLLPSLAFGFPTTITLDSFTRGDENPVLGIWSNGVFGGNGCRVIDETLRKSGTGTDTGCWVTSTFTSEDQEVFATMPNATGHAALTSIRFLLCLNADVGTANVDGYAVEIRKVDGAANDQMSIERVDDAAYTQLGANVVFETDDNDKMGGEHLTDGTLNFWYDDAGGGWTNLIARNDTTHACANTAIGTQLPNTSNHVDDFGGGNFVPAAPADINGPFMILQFR
jgi:hypothetical protein